MSDQPLFNETDAQEQVYAPQQTPANERVHANETGGIIPKAARDVPTDADAPTPVITGTNVAAAPASENFEPGIEREERDLARDDTSVVGRDPRDEPAR